MTDYDKIVQCNLKMPAGVRDGLALCADAAKIRTGALIEPWFVGSPQALAVFESLMRLLQASGLHIAINPAELRPLTDDEIVRVRGTMGEREANFLQYMLTRVKQNGIKMETTP